MLRGSVNDEARELCVNDATTALPVLFEGYQGNVSVYVEDVEVGTTDSVTKRLTEPVGPPMSISSMGPMYRTIEGSPQPPPRNLARLHASVVLEGSPHFQV